MATTTEQEYRDAAYKAAKCLDQIAELVSLARRQLNQNVPTTYSGFTQGSDEDPGAALRDAEQRLRANADRARVDLDS